jgi:hypothetical protein
VKLSKVEQSCVLPSMEIYKNRRIKYRIILVFYPPKMLITTTTVAVGVGSNLIFL